MDEYNSYNLLHDVVDLSNQGLDSGAVKHIEAALLKKPGAIALDLGWNSLGDDGVVALVELMLGMMPNRRRLLSIDLWANGVGPRGGQALAKLLEAPNCSLTSLNLRKNDVGVPGAVAILEALRNTPTHKVTALDLSMNGIDGLGEAAVSLGTPLGREDLTPAALRRLILALSPPAISVAQMSPKGDSAQCSLPVLWMSAVQKQFRLDATTLSLSTNPSYEGVDNIVFKAQRWVPGRSSNEEVAVKVFRPCVTDTAIAEVARRYAALKAHSQLVGVCERPNGERCIVTSWAARSSLAELFDRDSPQHTRVAQGLGPLYRRVRVCVDVAKALRDLHTSQRLAHTALQPRTVLLDHHHRARLGGLRHVVELAGTSPLSCPPHLPHLQPLYIAPEVLAGQRPSASSDIFSFGTLCCGLLATPPTAATPSAPPGDALMECPPYIVSLLSRCLLPDPTSRPDISSLATGLREWLRQLMSPEPPAAGGRNGTAAHTTQEQAEEAEKEWHFMEAEETAGTSPSLPHNSFTLRPDASFGEARRVFSMSLPLGGTLTQRHPSISQQPSDRSRSVSMYEVSSEAEQRVGRALNLLFERMDGCEDHLATTHELLCQLLPLQDYAAQVTHVTRHLTSVYAKLEALERSLQSTAAKPQDTPAQRRAETPKKTRPSVDPSDEVTFLELREHSVQLSCPAAPPTPRKTAEEDQHVDRMVKAIVKVEVEKVQKEFHDRLQAIESLTINQFQQLATKQLQLESQMQHFAAKCDPTSKKGRVKLSCETKLAEMHDEVTALRNQLQQSVEKVQQQLHSPSSADRHGLRGQVAVEANAESNAAVKKKPSGHVSWEQHSPHQDSHVRLRQLSPRSSSNHTEGRVGHLRASWSVSCMLDTLNAPTAADYCVDRCRMHDPKGWISNPLASRADGASNGGPRLSQQPLVHHSDRRTDSPTRTSARSFASARSVLGPLLHKKPSSKASNPRPPAAEEAAGDAEVMSRQPSAILESARSDTRRVLASTRVKALPKEAAARPRPSSPEERAASVRRGSFGRATATVAAALSPSTAAAPLPHRPDATLMTRSHLPHLLLKR